MQSWAVRYLTRFGWIFLICLVIVLGFSVIQGWQEAGAIGFLEGGVIEKFLGFLEYWLFWIILYTGPTFLIATFVMALMLTLFTLIYDAGIWLLGKRRS